MRHTSVDKRSELVFCFELGVKNVRSHIYDLQKLHLLIAFLVVFYSELNKLVLLLDIEACARSSLQVAEFHFKYCLL